MKNWGWVIGLILVVSIVGWFKFGMLKPALNCLYSDTAAKTEWICVNKLATGAIIQSPLQISGRARGNWFFEASFPIELLGQNGGVLASALGQAQGDWMTEDLVPFTAELTFTAPSGDTGRLVLKRDNPSGLPQNDAEFIVPIRFR